MACFGLSCSSSPSQAENHSCIEKPLTKAALLVIGLLFAGGAIASHFTGLGIPGIVAFSLVGGGSIVVLIIACFRSPAIKSNNEATSSTKTPQVTATQSIVKHETEQKVPQDMKVLVKSMTFGELVCRMVPGKNKENRLIEEELRIRITSQFVNHANKGATAVAQALQPLFSEARSSPENFAFLAGLAVCNDYASRFQAAVLEQLEWPNEEMKKEKLPSVLLIKILREGLSWQSDFINFGTHDRPRGFNTYRLVIVTKKIFGIGDFVKEPIPMPESLMEALGRAIRFASNSILDELREMKKEGSIDKDTKIGFRLVVGQRVECRFPASMISPLLPHLNNLPGLVGLELSDIGIRNPRDSQEVGKTGHGFGDQDADALLEVFRTNPHLIQEQICVDGMSEEKLKEFIQAWQQIMEKREQQPPCIEQLLSSSATP